MRLVGALALFIGVLASTSTSATPVQAATAAVVDDACYSAIGDAPQVGVRLCRGGEQLKRVTADKCRTLGQGDTCAVIDGRKIGAAHMSTYERSWVHRALGLQRAMGDDVALARNLLPHTHNSFNSPVYNPPTVTNQDPNQAYSITDQLRMDMRAIEFDVHWFPSLRANPSTGYKAAVLCHGQVVNGIHVGCSVDRPFRSGLRELRSWLDQPANRREFVLLYLENNLDDDPTAHQVVAGQIQDVLGNLVARPPAGRPCAPLNTSVTPAQMRAKGQRVLIVGNCGPGAWGTWVHERNQPTSWVESSSPQGDDYPGLRNCAAERRRTKAGTALVRWYEDGTWLSATVGNTRSQLTAREATAMANCGVNLIGFDHLTPQDPRLEAIVWSWARNEPRTTGKPACAMKGTTARWNAASCGVALRYACSFGPDRWVVTSVSGPARNGQAACRRKFRGSRFAVPRNGYENQLLHAAAGGRAVWLNYADRTGDASWSAA